MVSANAVSHPKVKSPMRNALAGESSAERNKNAQAPSPNKAPNFQVTFSGVNQRLWTSDATTNTALRTPDASIALAMENAFSNPAQAPPTSMAAHVEGR